MDPKALELIVRHLMAGHEVAIMAHYREAHDMLDIVTKALPGGSATRVRSTPGLARVDVATGGRLCVLTSSDQLRGRSPALLVVNPGFERDKAR